MTRSTATWWSQPTGTRPSTRGCTSCRSRILWSRSPWHTARHALHASLSRARTLLRRSRSMSWHAPRRCPCQATPTTVGHAVHLLGGCKGATHDLRVPRLPMTISGTRSHECQSCHSRFKRSDIRDTQSSWEKKINCASTMTYIYTVHPSVSVLVTLTVFQVFSTFHMNFHLHFVVHLKRRRSATQLSHECQDGKSWILEIVLADVHKCFVNVFAFAGRYSVQHFFVNHACGIPNQA